MRFDPARGIVHGGLTVRAPRRPLGIPDRIDRRLLFPKPGSKTAAIIEDLKADLLSASEIARKHGCSPPNVSRARRRAIERGVIKPGPDETVVVIGPWHCNEAKMLRQAALARGRHHDDLIRAIVRKVIVLDMIDEILGEAE